MKQKTRKKFNFADLFIDYKGKWVALNKQESGVFGVADSIEDAMKQAKEKGIRVPILFKVPKKVRYFVGVMVND